MKKRTPLNPGIKATLVGAAANLFLAVIKFVGGIVGNSTALVADAVHSLSDLLTDGVVLFTHKIGSIPRDEDHPYGHGRAETIGATIVGAIIILAGIGLGVTVWEVISSGAIKVPGWLAGTAAVFSILTNEWLYGYTRKIGERMKSPALIANAWHHRSDAISSVAALIGIMGAALGVPVMDPIAGGVVGLMVIKVGYNILTEGVRDLMDTALSVEKTKEIQKIIDGIPQVLEFHDLRTRRIGGVVFMDVHILVDTDLTVTEGHKTAESVRRKLINAMDNVEDVLVHVDAEDDSKIEPIYQATREDLQPIIDPVFAEMNGAVEKTALRVHYFKGKTIVDLYVRVPKIKTIAETEAVFKELRTRLEGSPKIDEARIYLDLNSQ